MDNAEERYRIENLGGVFLYSGGKLRLNGELSVTRAIGSYNLFPYLTDEAEIYEMDIQNDDRYLIIGSDGIINFVMNSMITPSCTPIELAKLYQDIACSSGSMDNTTVIVVNISE